MSNDKIITPGFAQAQPQTSAPARPPKLTREIANQIGGALQKLNELQSAAIETPTSREEIAGLQQYLANTVPAYAAELLGHWFVVRNEYEPLVTAVGAIFARVNAAHEIGRRAAQAEAKAPQCCGNCEPSPTCDACSGDNKQ